MSAEKEGYRPYDGVPVVLANPVVQQPTYAAGQPNYPPGYPPQYGYPASQGSGYPSGPMQVQHVQQRDMIPNLPPPRGMWGSNICDWPLNLFPSCWCALCCWHGCWIVGQMSEKTNFASFRTVAIGYVVMWIVVLAIMFTSLANTGVWLPFIFMMLVNILLRLHIVKTRQITECGQPADGCGNLTGECCCGFWCTPCAIAQQARHLYGYTQTCDGDARVDRPDSYTRGEGGGQVQVQVHTV